jgi:membrane fusion protein (multidrug efflux system)
VKPTLFLLILALLILAGSACQQENEIAREASIGQTVMKVDYVIVRPQAIANQLNVTGSLMAAESATLSAQTAGLVKEIHFREGQRVRKGQLLVTLDDRQWQARLQKLNAQISTAEQELARQEQLLEIQGITQAEVDAAALNLATLQADRQELEVMLDYALIRAPFSGIVGLRNVSPGAYLAPGDPVVQLVQVDPLRLEFSVPERYATSIRKGQRVRFKLADQDQRYEAQVYASDPAIDEDTRALRVRARVPNAERKLVAGAFTEINLTLDSIPEALLVPTEAIIPRLNQQMLYRIRGGKIEEVVVESGLRLPWQVEIRSGLQAGDTIMVSGLLQAKAGLDVAPDREIKIDNADNLSL